MTQEEKDLLSKDLCGRLPYGVICLIHNVNGDDYSRSIIGGDIDLFLHHFITLKPYLRPMSSMTEEEYEYYNACAGYGTYEQVMEDILDFLHRKHFDYRGLIEKGLAIEVTEENNPYKE